MAILPVHPKITNFGAIQIEMERRFSFSTTSELLQVPAEAVVYAEADGNYSSIITADGVEHVLTLQIGQAKSGFCAIINDEITISVAQSTPLLERVTEENGYFFRQYPLVYEGEIIENKLENLSQRKALATLNDEVVVVLSHDRLSLLDFSRVLVDLGVKNAIYLVGSSAYLKAKLEDGSIYEFGERASSAPLNSNYIFWQ